VSKVAPGDRVLMSYNSCGVCASCRVGRPGFCHDFFGRNFACTRPDGSTPISSEEGPVYGHFFGQSSFATQAIARERNVVKVADDAPLEKYCPLGCGIQTGAGAVMNALNVTPGSAFVVFGVGPVGLSAVIASYLVGARQIVAVDLNDGRLALAREFGATETVNAQSSDVVSHIREITGGGANFTLDTTGSAAVIRQATDILAPRGVCAILGSAKVGTELCLDMVHMMTGGRQLRGTVEGDSTPDVIIPQLIAMHERGRFPFDRMITYYDFEDINRAMAETETGACIKAVLRMPPTNG
jgi:aryl-alcohol dehydrogenase